MTPCRLSVTCCTLLTIAMLSACSADPSKDDDALKDADQTSSTTTTPTNEPTYTYNSGPGEVFLLPKDSDFGTIRAGPLRGVAHRQPGPLRGRRP